VVAKSDQRNKGSGSGKTKIEIRDAEVVCALGEFEGGGLGCVVILAIGFPIEFKRVGPRRRGFDAGGEGFKHSGKCVGLVPEISDLSIDGNDGDEDRNEKETQTTEQANVGIAVEGDPKGSATMDAGAGPWRDVAAASRTRFERHRPTSE
jgi:hypothetical protein